MVQPQTDQDQFRNISNLDLVKPNRIRDWINACIRLLFVNFLMLKMFRTCTYHSTMLTVTSITFLFCGWCEVCLYEINKNNRATATHGPVLVQEMFWDQTKAMLEWTREVEDQDLIVYCHTPSTCTHRDFTHMEAVHWATLSQPQHWLDCRTRL